MNDKKNIDRLFQEKFKDFEVSPDEAVWEKIKARNKRRKRVLILPFWYKVAGVAALLAIIFTIGYVSVSPESKIETIVSNDSENKKEILSRDNDTIDANPMNTTVVSSENEEIKSPDKEKKKGTSDDKVFTEAKTIISNSENATVSNSEKNLPEPLKNQKGNSSNPDVRITDNSVKQENQPTSYSPKKEEDIILKNSVHDKGTIADQQGAKSEKKNPLFTTPQQEDNTTANGVTENKTTINKSTKERDSLPPEAKLKDDVNKKSIFDAIAQEDEPITEETTSSKKWNVSPNVAPVYYSSIGNGSSIDSQFADNSKGGEVNLSYGVQVSYNINPRLSVRSGINKVDLSYNTKGIGFSPSTLGQNLESIDYAPNSENIRVSDIDNTPVDISNNFSEVNRDAINQPQNVGFLNQEIGYIEVPLEMKYALVNKKLGINMIGGVSTLFLQDNQITIEAGNFESPVGKANNLNDVSFSGNIGLGVDYKLSDQFQINLEPIFKYQFNAFSGNTENFKPFYFGVYTGVSIKF